MMPIGQQMGLQLFMCYHHEFITLSHQAPTDIFVPLQDFSVLILGGFSMTKGKLAHKESLEGSYRDQASPMTAAYHRKH